MRERKSRKAGDVKMCTGCHKFIASATFYRHLCRSTPNPVRTSTLLPLQHHDTEFKERDKLFISLVSYFIVNIQINKEY